jgi:class 3 adenylate cyclase/CHASE2 domain-containing sensor protein
MTNLQKRHLRRSIMRGTLLAAVALLIDSRGYIARLEHIFYDIRAAQCQHYRPPPTDKLVHLDIDDGSLSNIGKWPWPLETEAMLLDEIKLAQPKVVAMDILFGEAVRPAMGREFDTRGGSDPNEELAGAVKRLGCALLPISASFESDRSAGPFHAKLLELLVQDPQLTETQCIEQLKSKLPASQTLPSDIGETYLAVRPEAIYKRIDAELDHDSSIDLNGVMKRLLPNENTVLTGSVLRRLFKEQYDAAMRVREMRRFSIPLPVQSLPVLHGYDEIIPQLPLCRAAALGGFVSYLPDEVDGSVRSVPLVIEDHGRLLPQMALAAACAGMDVDIRSLKFSADAILIPRPGQSDLRIPLSYRQSSRFGAVGMLMDVPLFGPKRDWQVMYDVEQRKRPLKHVSMYKVYQAALTDFRINTNEATTDQVILNVLNPLDPKAAGEYSAAAPHHGTEQRAQAVSAVARLTQSIKSLAGSADPDDLRDAAAYKTSRAQLQELLKQTGALRDQLESLRSELRDDLGGRVVFLGGTATGNGDFYPTSLHYACPGVLIHGAVFNAIMTGKMWSRSSPWVDASVTLGTGLLVMVLVTLLTPFRAFVATVLIVCGYLFVNGYLLFDRGNLIVDAAGPTVAGLLVWGGLTLTNIITERAERARIERRFRSYVDPSLVTFVLQHPEQSRLDGQTREMSMGFTDLEGFTAMTEKLKEKTIPLLAEYMGEMIPVIRAHGGFVSKLMGDGIFFFYGAPEPNPNHATDAVNTMLGMRKALAGFNIRLAQRGMPTLEMRAGVNSGMVIVGDAGTPDASDYTAMGEATNLASRLESGNKPFGTHSMITHRTLELIGDAFLVRPIAKLQVVGTTEGIQVFEPLARRDEATDQQRLIAEITTAAIKAFQEGRFADSLAVWKHLEAIVGTDKLIKLYRRLCEEHLKNPPENFSGVVTLKEK